MMEEREFKPWQLYRREALPGCPLAGIGRVTGWSERSAYCTSWEVLLCSGEPLGRLTSKACKKQRRCLVEVDYSHCSNNVSTEGSLEGVGL